MHFGSLSERNCTRTGLERSPDLSDHPVRGFGEVVPGEPEHPPPGIAEDVLPVPVRTKSLRSAVPRLAVDLERQLLVGKGHIDLVPEAAVAGLPSRYPRAAQQSVEHPLRMGRRTVRRDRQ